MTTSGGRSRGFWPLKLLRKIFQEEKTSTWKYWERAIAVVGSLGTVCAIFLIYYQTTQTNKQIEAMWYSMKPSLRVWSITNADVKIPRGIVYTYPDTASGHLAGVWHTLENVGQNEASIDSIVTDFVFAGWLMTEQERGGGRMLDPDGKLTTEVVLPLDSSSSTWLRLRYWYSLADRPSAHYYLIRVYEITRSNDTWTFRSPTPAEFNGIAAVIPDANRVVLRCQ
jgi:hypothetical protein